MVRLSYREYPPAADLASWIACFWQIEGAVAPQDEIAHRVLPDGCADLIFDLRHTGGHLPSGALVGPMSTGIVVGLRGQTDLLGVRLRPGALRAFLGMPADRLLDLSVSLREAPLALRLDPTEMAALPDTAARIALLTAACRTRLATVKEFDPIVRYALAKWRYHHEVGFPSVSVLVRDIGLSERAFERRFVASVGLTPVRFRRLARLRSVLGLHSRGTRDWAALAAAVGYSDQSHLVRDFQAFVGLTPSRWAATQVAHAGFVQDGRITAL